MAIAPAVINRGPDILVAHQWIPADLDRQLREWSPKSMLGEYVKNVIAKQLPPDMMAELIEMFSSICIIESSLALVKIWGPHGAHAGMIEDLGIVGRKVVTTAGATEVITRFAGTSAASIANFKFHALGTGTTAEAIGDTALVTELTTEYTGNVRATGTQSASTNVYTTPGTNTLDSGTPAVTEHGILTQAATGGGTLLDRTKFSAVNMDGANGDGLTSTYSYTLATGG